MARKSDVQKVRDLFNFLRETYTIIGSHIWVGKVYYYVDKSDTYYLNEDDDTVNTPDPIDEAYFEFSLDGSSIQHNGQGLSIRIKDGSFKDFDLNQFIRQVKAEFKKHGELRKKLKAKKKKVVAKVKKTTKKPVKKTKITQTVKVNGVRYKLVPLKEKK